MRAWASIFLLSILLASAGARWLQLEYCNLDYALNTTDTPCSCMLTSFNPKEDGSATVPSSGIRSVTAQMCDMICETNERGSKFAEKNTLQYFCLKSPVTKGFLQNNWQPPELRF